MLRPHGSLVTGLIAAFSILAVAGCSTEPAPPPEPTPQPPAAEAPPEAAPEGLAAPREALVACEAANDPVPISVEELASWETVGPAVIEIVETPDGPVASFGGTVENPDTIVFLSPAAYSEDVVVRFSIRFNKRESIAVTVLSASTPGTGEFLTMPEGHPDWFFWGHPTDTGAQSYLFSIHTAFHQRDALLRKRPGRGRLHATPDTVNQERRWYELEMGKIGNLVWMDRDGLPFLEATDPEPLPGGRIAFMFSAEGDAGFQVRDVSVLECP